MAVAAPSGPTSRQRAAPGATTSSRPAPAVGSGEDDGCVDLGRGEHRGRREQRRTAGALVVGDVDGPDRRAVRGPRPQDEDPARPGPAGRPEGSSTPPSTAVSKTTSVRSRAGATPVAEATSSVVARVTPAGVGGRAGTSGPPATGRRRPRTGGGPRPGSVDGDGRDAVVQAHDRPGALDAAVRRRVHHGAPRGDVDPGPAEQHEQGRAAASSLGERGDHRAARRSLRAPLDGGLVPGSVRRPAGGRRRRRRSSSRRCGRGRAAAG